MENQENNSLFTPILYFVIAPLPVAIIIYKISELLLSLVLAAIEQENGAFGKLYVAMLTFEMHGNVNFFQRIYPLVAIGCVVGSILLIPKSKRRNIVGPDRFYCAVRANCVALATLSVIILMLIFNPFGEVLSQASLKGEGIALTWSQIFVGAGAFVLFQRLFMFTKSEAEKKPGAERRPEEPVVSQEEDFYIHKPEPARSSPTMLGNAARQAFVRETESQLDKLMAEEWAKAQAEGRATPEARERLEATRERFIKAAREGFEKGFERAADKAAQDK